ETLRTELHRRTSRLTSLKEIHDRYEGFQRGTRAVMQRADEIVDARSDAAAIHGVVADVVRAPELLEIAVEAALGDRLGGVLVSDPEVGLAAIGFLKQGGGGRSAFRPVAEPAIAPTAEPVGGVAASAARDSAAPAVPAARDSDVVWHHGELPPFEGEGGAASWISPASDPSRTDRFRSAAQQPAELLGGDAPVADAV